MDVIPIILSGGIGSRLWPLSRKIRPKPFIKLDADQSFIQLTYSRAVSIPSVKEIVTVTNRDLYFHTRDEYEEIMQEPRYNTFILEPFGRNSAAAIALATHYVNQKYNKDAILLIFPADHIIKNQEAFHEAVYQAIALASKGELVTFGIPPKEPKTGYGYIKRDKNKCIEFIEKPDCERAQSFIDSGNYLWNSGMFCMQVDTVLKEMNLHCAEISIQAREALNKSGSSTQGWYTMKEIKEKDFEAVPDISIDYALLEKSNKVSVISCHFGWSDIGSFLEFSQLFPFDKDGNHISADVVLEDVKNSFIYSEKRLVAGIGLKDLMIVDSDDAIFIADKNRAQEVRKIVGILQERAHPSHECFEVVRRPWGSYYTLQEGIGYKIKEITVKPGASLSLQSHQYRSEHWVVVKGTAKIINGEQTLILRDNQSTYIPASNKHRLENPDKVTLVLIEVQCGSYLGEDDIVRYEDTYGRINEECARKV